MPEALVVADDLTGATDTAHAFAKRGYETAVQVDPEAPPPDATVLAVNTASRYTDPETARNRATKTVSNVEANIVYDKVDSTLRGNIAPEIDGIMDHGFDYGLFAPAAPALGRLTAAGYHLVDGQLLSGTEYANDPKGPSDAYLPSVIEGVAGSIGRLDIGTTAAGERAVRDAIADGSSASVIACDAVHERHLDAVATAGRTIDRPVLYIGSAGLAEQIAVPAAGHGSPVSIDVGENGALGVVGSVSETTFAQLRAIPEDWILELDGESTVSDPERTGTNAGRRAADRIANGDPAVITAATNGKAVERTVRAGERAGIDAETIRARVAAALASATAAGIDPSPAGLFITGGETAMRAFGRLNATGLSLSGEDVEAGVPVSRLQGGPKAGTTVITKAGGFGTQSTVVNCLRFLGASDE